MSFRLKHRRDDGTFRVDLAVPGRGTLDYHVVQADPLFAAVAAAAEGVDLPPEPRPAPVVDRRIALVDFLRRLTKAERRSIRAAARRADGHEIEDWLDLLRAAPLVDLDSDFVTDGVALLLAAGLLTGPRAAAILA
jgi:hypothetical protein